MTLLCCLGHNTSSKQTIFLPQPSCACVLFRSSVLKNMFEIAVTVSTVLYVDLYTENSSKRCFSTMKDILNRLPDNVF